MHHRSPESLGRAGTPRPAGATAKHEGRSVPLQTRRVLLVDDDASLRMLYRFNLEASGVQVIEAGDGESALRLLDGELPDAVLLDVMMPGVDGWEVAERLRADERTRRLPILFITARAEEEARARGLAFGSVSYLVKPFNPVLLADAVEELLAAPGDDESDP